MHSSTTPKFDPNKPVTTRDGKAARIICQDFKGGGEYTILALLTEEGVESIGSYTKDGAYSIHQSPTCFDLINPVKKGYVVVYQTNDYPSPSSQFLPSKKKYDNYVQYCRDKGWTILFSSEFDIQD